MWNQFFPWRVIVSIVFYIVFHSTIPLKGGFAFGTVYSYEMYADVFPKSNEYSKKFSFFLSFFLFIKESYKVLQFTTKIKICFLKSKYMYINDDC